MIVTLALERKYKLHEGTRPRVTKSLIGDVTIDMQPGSDHGNSRDRQVAGECTGDRG